VSTPFTRYVAEKHEPSTIDRVRKFATAVAEPSIALCCVIEEADRPLWRFLRSAVSTVAVKYANVVRLCAIGV
jgi:hypothetical protein